VERGIIYVLEELLRDHQIGGYTISRELLPGVYERMLTGTRPISPDENINQIFSTLDYTRGDAYMITFSFEFS
jgi:hypothetical protein